MPVVKTPVEVVQLVQVLDKQVAPVRSVGSRALTTRSRVGLTAMIEIAGFRQVRCSNEALSRTMRVLFDRFGARLHWGQTLPAWLGPRELRTMYPETSIDAFVRARGVLDKRNLFGNALSRRLQLDPR